MSDVMIEATNLGKRYDAVQALQSVSFTVQRGQVVGFLGPNGAGKTTTMKILTCFIAPSEGTAKVYGCDVFDDPIGVRKALGYLPEHTPLYTEMLVVEYLEFIANMRGIRGPEVRSRTKRVVEETGLGDVIAKEIRALSKGYRQRVGLAQALIHEPPILILDEPMSGLDPNQATEIRDVIKEIGKQRTVILSTHNLAEVQVTCDRVLIIAKGRIVADDTPQQLQGRSGKPRFVITLLSSSPTVAETAREAFGKIPGVESVRVADGAQGELRVEVIPVGTDDLRAEISRAAGERGLTMVGLSRESENLEQIFRQLTLDPGRGNGKTANASSTNGPSAGHPSV